MNFDNYIARINAKLADFLAAESPLKEVMNYSVLSGGKRFRAILVYATANAFEADLVRADSAAFAVELIHAYSLIHDDLPTMDDDDIRHNQPACHKRFGEALAILAGDGLQALAFHKLAFADDLPDDLRVLLAKELSAAAFAMAEGQALDLEVVAKSVEVDKLDFIYSKKTGALINCAVKMGALLSPKCQPNDAIILDNFAKDLGLAYQIQDDVLDISTSDAILGKNQNSDIANNKPTYPSILGLAEAKKTYQNLYTQAQTHLKKLSLPATELIQLTQHLSSRNF